ncbi:MAG: FGGY-family carbohydrate kinase, partial [Spirochaetales bacterium]
MRAGLDAFRALGFSPKEIRLIGGGAKSALWRRIASDILNVPIKIPLQDEAAALGAALQALWCFKSEKSPANIEEICAEHIRLNENAQTLPQPEQVSAYNTAYEAYMTQLKAVMPLYT